jgi:hypothetical protein
MNRILRAKESLVAFKMFIIIFLSLFLKSCATTFGIIPQGDKEEFGKILKTKVEDSSNKNKGSYFYAEQASSHEFLNTAKYQLLNVIFKDFKCSTLQDSHVSYAITCMVEMTFELSDSKGSRKTYVRRYYTENFKNKYELKSNSDDFILKTLHSMHFSEDDIAKAVRAKPDFKKFEKEILNREISEGMPEYLLYLSWGKPQSENIYSSGRLKQLIYGKIYVYIKRNKIESWQKFGGN